MAAPTLNYRIWQRGGEWHWQLTTDVDEVIASGVANTSVAARSAAFGCCLQWQREQRQS